MLLFQHPGAMQETLPVGLSLTLTWSLDMGMTSDGLGLRGGAACLELHLKQENWREHGASSRWEGHLRAVMIVTREGAKKLEIRNTIVETLRQTPLERN